MYYHEEGFEHEYGELVNLVDELKERERFLSLRREIDYDNHMMVVERLHREIGRLSLEVQRLQSLLDSGRVVIDDLYA